MSGGIIKPKDRKTYRVWIPWKGKPIFFNRYFDGSPIYHEKQATRVLERLRSEIEDGTFDPALWGKDRTLAFPNAWTIYQKQCPCGEARHADRDRIYRDYLFPYFGKLNLKEIEEHHVLDWFSKLPEHLSPAYRRMILATIKGFLHFHRVTRVKAFAYPTVSVPRKNPPWLTREDQDKVFEFIPTQHIPIFTLIRVYGCRPSEACNLRKSDVDWEKREITFRERKNYEENTLPILPEIEGALKSKRQVNHWELVFCTIRGRKYCHQSLYATWMVANRQAHEKYGVRVVPLKNATRHSLASQLLEKGHTIPMIARILGNSPGVVERSYGRVRMKAVAGILGSE